MSVSQFDEKFLVLLRDGGTKGVELHMDKSAAVALRHRLYRLRQAMKREGHPWLEVAERASISIAFGPDANSTSEDDWVRYSVDKQLFRVCAERGWNSKAVKWKLRISPPDRRFDEALAAAGYTDEEAPPL